MIERTRQITQNYKSVTPVIIANPKTKLLQQQQKIAQIAFENPLQGYDAISARYDEIMGRKKDDLKRKRAFVELKEVTRNIQSKIETLPQKIPLLSVDSQTNIQQDSLVKLQILAEKRKQLQLQSKMRNYASEVGKVNKKLVNKYLVPLNPRVYMAPR